METPTKHIDRVISWMMSTSIVLTAAILLIGCGGEGKKRGNPINNGLGGVNCPGCVANGDRTNLVYSGLGNSTYNGRAQIALDFYATQPVTTGGYGNRYSGPVQAQGTLFAFQISAYGCPIPSGAYQVYTETPGFVDSVGTVKNVRLIAQNGADQIRLRINQAVFIQASPKLLACNGAAVDSEMWDSITIESVNGFPCSYSNLNVGYQGGFSCQ